MRVKLGFKESLCIFIFFITGDALAMPLASMAKKDVWISILVALVAVTPMIFIYSRILGLFHDQDIVYILKSSFNKTLGTGLSIIIMLFSFYLGALVLGNAGLFAITLTATKTPLVVFILIFTFLACWISKYPVGILGKWANLFIIPHFIIISSLALALLPYANSYNIYPLLEYGTVPVINGFISIFSFPFLESFIFVSFISFYKSTNNYSKLFFNGIFLGGFLLFIVAIVEILILGENDYSQIYYPIYALASRVSISNTIERLELVPLISISYGNFVKTTVCLLNTCNIIDKIFNLNNSKILILPVGILMAIVGISSSYTISTMMQTAEFWPFIAIPCGCILPILIWFKVEYDKLKKIEKA